MCLREVRQSPSCGAPINGGPSRPALRRMQGSSSRSGVRQQGCDRQYEVLADTFIVKAFSAHQPPAVRYKLPKCSASSANTTPVLRTEGFHIPKVRQTFFFFTDQTAIFLLMFQKKNGGLKAASLGTHAGGCYPPLRCAATERNTKKYAPVPWYWDESEHTLRGATQIQDRLSPLASCYGEGAVGVSAPAPPLSFV